MTISGSIGRISSSATSANDSTRKIRKLLCLANDPRTCPAETRVAKRIGLTMLAAGLERRALDIGDFLDVIPSVCLQYDDRQLQ
jgi:hypothetical protein